MGLSPHSAMAGARAYRVDRDGVEPLSAHTEGRFRQQVDSVERQSLLPESHASFHDEKKALPIRAHRLAIRFVRTAELLR
jgi:hypothetical protein